ncbi:hypothetical protein WA538_001710 [Blastocystis sp. DL]
MSQLSVSDLYPAYAKEVMDLGFSAQVYSSLPEGEVKAIGTHNGTFHSDEALSVPMLLLLPEYRNHVVVRTRDQNALNQCDIVVDVGGEYDPEKNHFDHHQGSFTETYDANHKTKMSSSGLIWKHFGKRIIKEFCKRDFDEATLQMIQDRMYDGFIEEVDGVDNGVDPYTGEKNYKVTTTVSRRVSRLLPAWNEEYTKDIENTCFRKAMAIMMSEFAEHLHHLVDVKLPARAIVEQAMNEAKSPILILSTYCPFMDFIFELEKERGQEGYFKFVLFEGTDGMWRVRAVNLTEDSFALRQKLLPDCLGLRDEELSTRSGIEGCVFVHIAGFMGVNKTKEGAMAMAEKSL